MRLRDAQEWFEIADADLDSAHILNDAYRKHLEQICYHCTQAAEKYLKGFLIYNEVIPKKTHNIENLLEVCISLDSSLKIIERECKELNKYVNELRYPPRVELDDALVNILIKFTEKIKNHPVFCKIREE